MYLQRLATFLTIAIVASSFSLVQPAVAAAALDPPSITFSGGGWGHGVGMSQYGALGRAEAGFNAEEILAFYYQGTQLLPAAGLDIDPSVIVDDIDVRVGTDNCSAFTPLGPNAAGSPSPVVIAVDGVDIADTTDPIAIGRSKVTEVVNGLSRSFWAWQILTGPGAGCNGRQPAVSSLVADVCGIGCEGVYLTITFPDGEPIAISAADIPGRRYAHGQIQLWPDGRTLPSEGPPGQGKDAQKCGDSDRDDFCIVVGDMSMQQYLYGLGEVPSGWHFEALRSQAIAGRSFALSTKARRDLSSSWHEPFNLYASTFDQNYVGWDKEIVTCNTCRWIKAVDNTNDRYVATADAKVATTFYSSSNGGYTNANEDYYSWAGWTRNPFSYLRANRDQYDNHPSNPNAAWERTYSLSDISKWLTDYPFGDLDVGQLERIMITESPSGYIDYSLVTLYGSKRTLEVRRGHPGLLPENDPQYDSTEPFGYRFWYAIQLGCGNTPGCDKFPGHRVRPTTFFDVDPTAYYADAVQWMTLNDLTSGVGPNEFAPGLSNDRATIAVFLWRFAGRPTPLPTGSFGDVPPGSYFATAVQWMVEKGITFGTTSTTFSPGSIITRAEAAAFLWRFAGQPTPSNSGTFDDVPAGSLFETAIEWMAEWRITFGTTNSTYSPEKPLTRADIATFLWHLAAKPGAFADGAFMPIAMRVP